MKRTTWIAVAILTSLASMLVVSSAAGQGEEGAQSAGILDYVYEVTNEDGIPFADAYERLGGVDTLGRPISNRFATLSGYAQVMEGYVLVMTEKGFKRWNTLNIFERFERAGLDDWLFHEKGIPRPIQGPNAGTWERKRQIRLSRLRNDKISAKFSANPNPEKIRAWNDDQAVRLYGLPMSYPERHGPFISQRFQKVAFRLWVEEVEGMPAPGTVELVQGGKLFKEAGLIPARALAPEEHKKPKPFPDVQPDPPITIIYQDYWGDYANIVTYGDYLGHHWIRTFGRDTRRFGTNGPFLNMYFPEEFVGRKLTIRQFGFVCKEGVTHCGPDYMALYRSLIGAIKPGRSYFLPLLTPEEVPGWYGVKRYEAELIAGGLDYEEIVWEIESAGVYFVYFGKSWSWVSGLRYYASGEERPANLPPLITYTVSVE